MTFASAPAHCVTLAEAVFAYERYAGGAALRRNPMIFQSPSRVESATHRAGSQPSSCSPHWDSGRCVGVLRSPKGAPRHVADDASTRTPSTRGSPPHGTPRTPAGSRPNGTPCLASAASTSGSPAAPTRLGCKRIHQELGPSSAISQLGCYEKLSEVQRPRSAVACPTDGKPAAPGPCTVAIAPHHLVSCSPRDISFSALRPLSAPLVHDSAARRSSTPRKPEARWPSRGRRYAKASVDDPLTIPKHCFTTGEVVWAFKAYAMGAARRRSTMVFRQHSGRPDRGCTVAQRTQARSTSPMRRELTPRNVAGACLRGLEAKEIAFGLAAKAQASLVVRQTRCGSQCQHVRF